MSLTLEEVKHIANLARLELSDEEITRFQGQLSAILTHFQQLESLDTEGVPPTASGADGQTPLRADISQPSLTLEELLRNAPERDEKRFRVPPVFE
jgi:aspartyl-tRNA(Asn)/glutamyl-tRNA(Gln) amidotransferase subunit C